MTAARASVPGHPTSATAPAPAPAHGAPPVPELAQRGLSPAAGNRAVARALADAAASRTPSFDAAGASRTLARCPGCGGTCGGTCGAGTTELDEELLASGAHALHRAVLVRQRALSRRS